MIDETLDVSRGWGVFTSDGHRIGDVTEVHPTYLLVSRGLVFVNDTCVPLHAIDRVEDNKVRLAVTRTVFRKMDWKKPPRTPLELVRPIDEEVAQDETPAAGDLLGEDSSATWDTGWDTSTPDYGVATSNTDESGNGFSSDYWNSLPAVDESAAQQESYDTLGILTGNRLEVEGGIGLAIQNVGYGRPIILLHDWLLGQSYWDSLVPRLVDEGYRVVTMDLRGHGASDRPWNEYWMPLLVHDLRTLVRTLDLDAPTIVGHGLGAAVALQYVTAYAWAGTRRLILVSPSAPCFTSMDDFTNGQDDSVVETWLTRLRTDRPTMTRHLIDSVLTADPLGQEAGQWLWEMAMRPPAYVPMQVLATLRTLDLRDDLARIAVPTTVLHGLADRLTHYSLGQMVAASIPGAEFLPFEGAGHLLGLEARDAFEETLLGLLTRDAEEDNQIAMDAYAPDADASMDSSPMEPDDSIVAEEAVQDADQEDFATPPVAESEAEIAP